MTRYIFCTGGVVSSVGKGVAASALGRVLRSRGLSIAILKLDPYLNVDPGTMSPYQHGEVFVTADGAETDLDLGHYERFTDEELTRLSNVTAGQVYSEVISQERRGDHLGGTIQVIPHITNEIKRRIQALEIKTAADVIIVELGGTVGDIEGQPFLEAMRQLRADLGRKHTLYVHLTYLVHIAATHELKTKPTQHSVRELRSVGIQPNVILARTDYPVTDDTLNKISLFCDVDEEAVIALETTPYLYEIPLILEDAGLGDYIVDKLKLSRKAHPPELDEWRAMVAAMKAPKPKLPIAIVGKYVELHDAYLSVKEALAHAGLAHSYDIDIHWIPATDLEEEEADRILKGMAGIVVPGGFGARGIEGKIVAATYAREHQIPYLGLCLGMQTMCVEFARNVLHLEDANSSEFAEERPTEHAVIDLMPDQLTKVDMGGTMRLGSYPCCITPETRAADAYQEAEITERHRHRYEFNNNYRQAFETAGMIFSGLSPDSRLVEIAEVRDHPFMVGTQFHPEFASRPNRPHALFKAFVQAAITYHNPVELAPQVATEPLPTAIELTGNR